MKKARIADLKNNLSRYLDHVRGGGTVLVLDRERPIAEIVPLGRGKTPTTGAEATLERLERRGVLRRGKGGLPPWFGKRPRPRVSGSVLRDVLAERRSGW